MNEKDTTHLLKEGILKIREYIQLEVRRAVAAELVAAIKPQKVRRLDYLVEQSAAGEWRPLEGSVWRSKDKRRGENIVRIESSPYEPFSIVITTSLKDGKRRRNDLQGFLKRYVLMAKDELEHEQDLALLRGSNGQ